MEIRKLRDEILLTLQTNFTPDQLQLIDNALMNILNGMDILHGNTKPPPTDGVITA